VADDLELTVWGQGSITFNQQLPAKAINLIKKRSDAAEIICAGQPLALHCQGYRSHNLGITTTNQRMLEQPQQSATALRQLSINKPPEPSLLVTTEDKYNPLTQDYLDRCRERKVETIADCIEKLNLTAEEEPLFKSCEDCIMGLYFDDIPVMYDEKYYNLNTLLYLHGNNKPDPFSRKPITLASICSARIIYDNLDNAIIDLNKKRAAEKDHNTEEEKPRADLSI
jgi:hypothetical protein